MGLVACTIELGNANLLLGAATASMEYQEDWLLFRGASLLRYVRLVLAQKLGVQFHLPWLALKGTRKYTYISGRVHSVNVTEPGGDREVWTDLREAVVNVENVFRLSVERAVLDRL